MEFVAALQLVTYVFVPPRQQDSRLISFRHMDVPRNSAAKQEGFAGM